MAVLSRRQDTSEQRRQAEAEFTRATVDLLARGDSYADLSVERIAAAAGRTRTAFYFYFRDKRDLLMRATEEVAAQLYAEADRWWSGRRGAEDLEEAIGKVLTIYRAHGPLLRAVVEASTYDVEVGRFWDEVIGPFIVATERRLQADGGLDRDAAHAKAFVLVWATERVCYQQVTRTGGRLDDEQAVSALVEVWERSVYPRS
jgi:AcrR family transcriptional regulator